MTLILYIYVIGFIIGFLMDVVYIFIEYDGDFGEIGSACWMFFVAGILWPIGIPGLIIEFVKMANTKKPEILPDNIYSCSKCGHPNFTLAKFCRHCGNNLEDDE